MGGAGGFDSRKPFCFVFGYAFFWRLGTVTVFLILKPYDDCDGNEHTYVEAVFLTLALAQEYVDFEIGELRIEAVEVFDMPQESTLRTQKKVAEGRIEISRRKGEGNVFVFPSR